MKTLQLTAAAALIAAGAPALAADASASASARIYKPINFAVLLEMDFGQVAVAGGGGTVVLDPQASTRNCSGGGIACTGSYSFSRLELSGSDAIVTISYAPSFQLTGPGAPMTVEPEFPGGSGSVIQLTGGSATIDFGARLTVNAGQVPGDYSGIFTVNVDYQ